MGAPGEVHEGVVEGLVGASEESFERALRGEIALRKFGEVDDVTVWAGSGFEERRLISSCRVARVSQLLFPEVEAMVVGIHEETTVVLDVASRPRQSDGLVLEIGIGRRLRGDDLAEEAAEPCGVRGDGADVDVEPEINARLDGQLHHLQSLDSERARGSVSVERQIDVVCVATDPSVGVVREHDCPRRQAQLRVHQVRRYRTTPKSL